MSPKYFYLAQYFFCNKDRGGEEGEGVGEGREG